MRRVFLILITLACLAVIAYGAASISEISKVADPGEVRALLIYNPAQMDEFSYVIDAYSSVLAEEGVPFERLDQHMLLSLDPEQIARHVPAIILPDGANQVMMTALESWIESYLKAGGSLMAVFDPGVKSMRGDYLPDPLLERFTAVDYMSYRELLDKAFGLGKLRFRDAESAERCQFPAGKLDAEQYLVGYGYGRLSYPVAATSMLRQSPNARVLADVLTDDGGVYPAVVLNQFGKGKVLYVDLPLGHAKALSDDLPLRSLLRMLLFDELQMPHLVNVPDAVGGLVINWHIDSNVEWLTLPRLFSENFLLPGLEHSFHITAGDCLDEPGDDQGFKASTTGANLVDELARHGTIGSHGGWCHNWFAFNIDRGVFGEQEITENIQRNSQSLSRIVGYDITEYSAPVGVYPQPLNTQILERDGYVGYYYTGDMGAAPNRSFSDKRMVSDKVFAFPVMPMRDSVSPEEFGIKAGYSDEEVRQWLEQTTQYAMRNRCIRLIYAHPYNLFEEYNGHLYGPVFQSFMVELQGLAAEGRIQVRSITTFGRYLQRFLKTSASFTLREGGMQVKLQNQEGLAHIAVAVPRERFAKPGGAGLKVLQDQRYYYIIIEDDQRAKLLELRAR